MTVRTCMKGNSMRTGAILGLAMAAAALPASAASAQAAPDASLVELRDRLARERAALETQQAALDAQRTRLQALESELAARLGPAAGGAATAVAGTAPQASQPVSVAQTISVPLPPSPPPAAGGQVPGGVQTVGEAPTDQREVQVAALAEQGGVITQAGRLTVEGVLEYARADRNRVVFRGIQIPAAVLIGAFDINESRQDVLTAGGVFRLGLSSRLEINGRVPFVYRSDRSVLAPVVDPATPNAGQIDSPVQDGGLGDIDFGVRYQFTDGNAGLPYLIAGVQVIAPSGSDPFAVDRDTLGNPREAATGAGFWAVSPNLTAILPSDPAVLFATLGYTRNFGRNINRQIGTALVERVRPGDQPSASVGIALSLNPRTSLSFGYAHTWGFGTETRLRTIDPQSGAAGDAFDTTTRDLQLGRFLFGVSYRVNPRTTINWNVELGATDDATDLRTTLRIPVSLSLF